MFTGLVQDVGAVEQLTPGAVTSLWIRTALGASAFERGESIAVNGCCLTVVETRGDSFRVEATFETLRRTTVGKLAPGSKVNLERALQLSARLGGHLVQGHVDDVTTVVGRAMEGGSLILSFALPASLAPFFIEKGSVTLDGVSLTVNTVGADRFSVALIPETQARTTLAARQVGEPVNLEADVIGKYVARMVGLRGTSPGPSGPSSGREPSGGLLSEEALRLAGFPVKG